MSVSTSSLPRARQGEPFSRLAEALDVCPTEAAARVAEMFGLWICDPFTAALRGVARDNGLHFWSVEA